MENNTRQRTVLYPHHRRVGGARGGSNGAGRQRPSELSVPNWFDLPVLLPETHVVAAKIQRNMTAKGIQRAGDEDEESVTEESVRDRFRVPKVSRLASPTRTVVPIKGGGATTAHAQSSMIAPSASDRFTGKTVYKRRNSACGVRLDGLPFDSRSRVRDKLWKDLNRFGLWHMIDPSDEDNRVSVEQTVDLIMTQLDLRSEESKNNADFVDSDLWHTHSQLTLPSRDTDISEPTGSTFLTAVPVETRAPSFIQQRNADTPKVDNPADTTDLIASDVSIPESEISGIDRESSLDRTDEVLRNELTGCVKVPGMKRRQRLKDLHQFIETQLQKRLLKSWDTIEIAFTGSGDMTAAQIVKFLQNSDVQLGATDAAKIKAILDSQEDEENDDDMPGSDSAPASAQRPTKKPKVFSYVRFRQIFRGSNSQDESRWKREFDRDKFRRKQEKEIYDRELAALEERVKARLAQSAKAMVEILDKFECEPKNLPWETEEQRRELRDEFFEIIFRKRQRQHISSDNASNQSTLNAGVAVSNTPDKLNVKVVRSALLQKYSRNGHFESIEAKVAAYLYHDYAADCIKRGIQSYWKRCETDLWPERQMIFRFRRKKLVFLEWRRFTKHAETLRQYIMRKFVAWKYLTRKRYEFYAFYRACFWPFYVWKRFLQQMIIARGKSVFIRNLVDTYIQLRHFRALKMRHRRKKWLESQLSRARTKKAEAVCRLCWDAWKERFESSALIRRIWGNRGHALQHLHKLYMVRVTFYIIRYYAMLKRDMDYRKDKCLLSLYSSTVRTKRLQQSHHGRNNGLGLNKSVASMSSRNFGANDAMRARFSASTSRMVGTHTHSPTGATSLDLGIDVDEYERDDGQSDELAKLPTSAATISENVHPLTRIMETEMGQRMKRKSRLYDLCLGLYLKYRERDQREMIGNVIIFRRVGRMFLAALRVAVQRGKRKRFSIDLGAFRVLNARYRQWMIGVVYKVPSGEDPDDKIVQDDVDVDVDDPSPDSEELHWVRDREWRRSNIEGNPLAAQQLRDDLLFVLANDSTRLDTIQNRELMLTKLEQNEEAFLRKEAGITHRIKVSQLQQAQQIMRMRGHRMHDALDHVYDDLRQQHTRWLLRSTFRSIRELVMMKYTETLCHRAQLRNWIRLCRRFSFWQQHIDEFYRFKVKYRAFQVFLRHAVWKWKLQTPQLSVRLHRRKQLMLEYEQYLHQEKLVDGSLISFHLAMTKRSPANSFRGVFLRWVQYTQLARVTTMMVTSARQKQEVALKYRVFHSLKVRIKAQYTLEYRTKRPPFLLRHFEADLDVCHCMIVAVYHRLPSVLLRAKIHRNALLTRQTATGSPTLKQLFELHTREINARLRLEQRLMFAAYNERKVHHYEERSSQLFGSGNGRAFAYEKAPPYGSVSEIVVMCGKKVDGLSFIVKTNAAVTFEGALQGNPFGNREVFLLQRGEVLVSLEGFASHTVYGLRFGTSSGRLSKWYGHCEKGIKFEIRSDYTGKREEIVGIFGYADGTSIYSLGAVMRHTTARNLFEGLWLQTEAITGSQRSVAVDEVALSDRQFGYFLQVRSCEVKLALERAHRFALTAYRAEGTPMLFRRLRLLMALTRWVFNGLVHGLVHCSEQEDEGQRVLAAGLEKKTAGDKATEEATRAIQIVDSFRGSDGQLDATILGVKKINELRTMLEQAQTKMAQAAILVAQGKSEIQQAQRLLPHVPLTKRMMTAIRKMYRVVQTKDYIDQMDPELRAILMIKDSNAGADDAAAAATSTS